MSTSPSSNASTSYSTQDTSMSNSQQVGSESNTNDSTLKTERTPRIDVEAGKKVTLVTSDNKRISVNYNVVAEADPNPNSEGRTQVLSHASVHLHQVIGEYYEDGEEVNLIRVSSDVLQVMLKFMKYHAAFPFRELDEPLGPDGQLESLDPFDQEFLDNMDFGMLLRVIEATNYLEIVALQQLTHAKFISIATRVCDDPDEIIKTFGPYMELNNFVPDYTEPTQEISMSNDTVD